ncbi:MAG: hypothetical protein ACK51F_05660 [Rhodospirillales bacterium]|jgi:hypothetical protein
MRGGTRIAAALAVALAMGGCAQTRMADGAPVRLDVGVAFELENVCRGSQSPAIAVTGLPAQTRRMAIRISNIGVLRQVPRDWIVDAPAAGAPARVPAGGLDGYEGPCPGDLQRPIYRVEVMALAADGAALAHGFREVRVMPVNFLARERRDRGGQAWLEDLAQPESFFGNRELFLRERDLPPNDPPPRQTRDGVIPAPRGPAWTP